MRTSPVAEKQRIASIDVLRGLALLGILAMNIQDFAMPGEAYWNPSAYGDLHGANLWVYLLIRTFADLKFLAIFSMLFGAGILLMAERADRVGARTTPPHYRRRAFLALFGL